MDHANPALARQWLDILALSAVAAGQRVAVLNRIAGAPFYRSYAIHAARTLGAEVTCLDVPDTDAMTRPALAALRESDLVVDLAFAHDPAVQELLAGGTRFLVVLEPPEILTRMFPTADDKRRVQAAIRRMSRAQTMRVTSPGGTDFTARLGDFKFIGQYGFADEPGHWDQWPGAFALTYPNEGTAEGTVVIDTGSMVFPYKDYVRTPIRLTIEGGHIRRVEGGFDADYMRDYLEAYRDPEVYAVSHIGWGLDHRAQWSALGRYDKATVEGQDGRAFYGNFLFSTGPNITGGGTRGVPCHLDIPMRGASVRLDDEPMVLDGVVIPADQRVPAAG